MSAKDLEKLSETRPNILLITTDQQRFDTISALGNEHIYTPHLNWLCDEGVAFTRCYTDSPICMAARATIMTGKHGYTNGLTGNSNRCKPMAEFDTIPGILTKAGYQTRAQGKMHFEPMRANYGFEHMELPMDYYRNCLGHSDSGMPKHHGVGENEVEPVISTVDEQHSLTSWTVDRSIDFLETRDETRPFFLWTSFTKPHPPFDPCANYWALYDNRPVPEPYYGQWSRNIEDIPQGFLKSTYLLNNIDRLSEHQLTDIRRAYYACITQVDYALGRLFARMREMNLLENTWIIFTSDHGDMQGDHHFGAKSVFLEGSAHIPMIIRPPHASFESSELSGVRCDTMVDLADVMPTVLSVAGVEVPKQADGCSLLELIDSKEDRVFFGSCADDYYAVIKNNIKYMWTPVGGGELMFDLNADPHETNDLATSGESGELLERMRNILREQIERYSPELIENGELRIREIISGRDDVGRWPGFHSLVNPTDVLH